MATDSDKMKLLVVDDEPDIRDALDLYLTHIGYTVFTAENGEQALIVFKQSAPSIILSDIKMPGIDGFEVLARIKQGENTNAIPVIILSNLGQKEDIEKGFNLGAVDYLIKAHFTPNEIIEKIATILI